MCIQADVLLYPVYHLGEESFVYSTRCTACIALSDISPGLKRVMYSTGCTSLSGISHINQGINDLKMHSNMAIPFFT